MQIVCQWQIKVSLESQILLSNGNFLQFNIEVDQRNFTNFLYPLNTPQCLKIQLVNHKSDKITTLPHITHIISYIKGINNTDLSVNKPELCQKRMSTIINALDSHFFEVQVSFKVAKLITSLWQCNCLCNVNCEQIKRFDKFR